MGEELKKNHDNHAKYIEAHGQFKRDMESHHGTVEQRLAYIEKEVGDSFDKHARQLEDFKKNHDNHAKQMEEFKGKHAMHDQVYGKHANLEERVAFLEKDVGASDIGRLHADLTARNSDIEGRLSEIEKALEQDLSASHMQLDSLAASVQHDLEEKQQLLQGLRKADKQLLRGNSFRPTSPPKSESNTGFSFSSRPKSQATPQDQRRTTGFR